MLRVNHLSFKYYKKDVLKDISFEIEGGNTLVLLGPNGSGKSTILKCLLGINKIKENEIFIDENDLKKLSYKERSRLIAYVSQENITSSLTVFDTILLGRLPYNYVYESKDDKQKVLDMANKLHINHLLDKEMDKISGGEKQKVLIAKALCQDTPIIIFDEPTNNLDITNQLTLINEIKRIAREDNKTIIISMHDINLSLDVGDKFLLIKNGEIFAYGDRNIINEANIKSVFNINTKIIRENGKGIIIYEKDDIN